MTDTQRALDAEAKLTDLAHELQLAKAFNEFDDFALSRVRLQRDFARRLAITGWIAAAGLAVVLVFVLGGK
jgi:hypothetical protein